jgi:hypothetical protein
LKRLEPIIWFVAGACLLMDRPEHGHKVSECVSPASA